MSLWNSTHAREASTNDGVFAQYKKEFLESIKRVTFANSTRTHKGVFGVHKKG